MKRILIAATALMVVVLVGLLMPVPFQGRAASALGDLVHAPLFGALTIGLLALLQRVRPSTHRWLLMRYVVVSLGMSAFGLMTEYAQRVSGRSSSTHDAIANAFGVCAGVLIFAAWQRRCQADARWAPGALIALAVVLLVAAWWRPVNILRDAVAVHTGFPLLGSFESTAELGRWYFRECDGAIVTTDVTDGSQAMEISYRPTSHPGATMIEFKTDWSAMQTLELDVTLDPSYAHDSVVLMVKVIDRLHNDTHEDTYRGEWKLTPGQHTHIRIPRDQLIAGPSARSLDLSQIKFVDLLLVEPKTNAVVRIDRLRLTL